MTIEKLIEIADDAYPDGLIKLYFEDPDGGYGDTLAGFIAEELKETFNDELTDHEQIRDAVKVLIKAVTQISYVIGALSSR